MFLQRNYQNMVSVELNQTNHVSTAAPIPEPATMLLFSTGLVDLAALKRKLKGRRV